jgi:hypothetical protein
MLKSAYQSRLIVGQLVDECLLLLLDLSQTFILDLVALELAFLLVQQVVQLHHLLFTVLILGLHFVAFTQCP